jgi:hypothetical protein
VTGNREGGHRHIRTALLVELQQVTVVHVIDMIAAEDQDMRRVDALQEGEVLVHRIRRPLILPVPHSRRRRNGAES